MFKKITATCKQFIGYTKIRFMISIRLFRFFFLKDEIKIILIVKYIKKLDITMLKMLHLLSHKTDWISFDLFPLNTVCFNGS